MQWQSFKTARFTVQLRGLIIWQIDTDKMNLAGQAHFNGIYKKGSVPSPSLNVWSVKTVFFSCASFSWVTVCLVWHSHWWSSVGQSRPWWSGSRTGALHGPLDAFCNAQLPTPSSNISPLVTVTYCFYLPFAMHSCPHRPVTYCRLEHILHNATMWLTYQ